MKKSEPSEREILVRKMQQEPHDYAYCVREDCKHRHECLHYLQYERSGDKLFFFRTINPFKTKPYGEEKCNFFADATRQCTYAIGFGRFVSQLNLDEKQRFQSRCKHSFCKTVYYDMRAGKRILYPWDQDIIREAAEHEHIAFPKDAFDYTFQAPAW